MGQKVKTLVDGITKAGTHTVTWDGTNEQKESVASGIYFYKLSAGDKVIAKKMSLLK
jgi:flagellar hook assembly protein FlgD